MGILRILAGCILAVALLSTLLTAAGFENTGLGVQARAMGGAFSAIADDWSAAYYNPAGYAWLKDNQIGGNTAFLHYRNELVPNYVFGEAGGIDTATGFFNNRTIYNKHAILSMPSAGFAARVPLMGETMIGFSIYQPFDQNISWDLYRHLQTYNDSLSTPSEQFSSNIDVVAFQFTIAKELKPGKLAFGLGLQLLRGDMKQFELFKRASPLGDSVLFGDRPYNTIDEYASCDGDGWGFGIRAGLLYKLNEKMKLGLSANIPFDLTIKGDANLRYIMPLIPGSKYTLNDTVKYLFSQGNALSFSPTFETKLQLPMSFGLGLSYNISEKALVACDVNYTMWSHFKGIEYTYIWSGSIQPEAAKEAEFFTANLSEPVEWKNTLKVGVGGKYELSKTTTLLGGFSYDQAVNPDNVGILPQFVDFGNKLGINGGTQLHFNNWDMGLVGSVIKYSENTVDRVISSDGTMYGFPGIYKGTTFETIFSINYRF
jgi:long-chain fatty acid transport protein